MEAWKSQDFNGVWTRDLTILVRRSNQLSYEATDIQVSLNQDLEMHMQLHFSRHENLVLSIELIKVK